ncbi:hypothetical protein C6A85_66690, partial [Mycobacterium sp. ITM-2017-0098]
ARELFPVFPPGKERVRDKAMGALRVALTATNEQLAALMDTAAGIRATSVPRVPESSSWTVAGKPLCANPFDDFGASGSSSS